MPELNPRVSDMYTQKHTQYSEVTQHIKALIEGETDAIAIMATVSCELHHHFDYYHWTGFYRVVAPGLLKIGPYQGTHGCIVIPFERGVCGAAARTQQTQLVPDVDLFPGHIACASTTRSEIVVPVFNSEKKLVAVLDADSNEPAAFDAIDQSQLEIICQMIGKQL